jgi:large subunit ribosomal protein L9
MHMSKNILLLEDVHGLGKQGEVVGNAKPGYIRNFLLPRLRRAPGEMPRSLAVLATPNMVRKQAKLVEDRAKQAVINLKESQDLAKQIESVQLSITVKVNPMGQMYGAVSPHDISDLLAQRGIPVDKRYILTKPIKETGTHKIHFKLKEEISASCDLTIHAEGVKATGIENVVKAIEPEKAPEATPEEPEATE